MAFGFLGLPLALHSEGRDLPRRTSRFWPRIVDLRLSRPYPP